ncbi:MAG: AMP-binding protein [Woeseiaceae bacterium]|nr:AMP-binding protein [Woeseiaceae bacterium]
MNCYQLFAATLRRRAGHPALVAGLGDKRQSLDFAGLDRKVDGVVATLAASGLRAGDKVLLAVPISIDTYAVMLALLKAGMVIMYIDPAHGAAQVSQILRRWPPAAIVASKPILLLGMLFPEVRRIAKRFVVGGNACGATTIGGNDESACAVRITQRSSADSAILSFTSGSTGEPKALIRTHGFLRKQLDILQRLARPTGDDIDFVAMPMFVLFNLANGITSVLPACNMKHPGRADPRIVLGQLCAEKATRMVASPALLDRLADHCLRQSRVIPDLRCISTGGGPVAPSLPVRLSRIAPNATIKMVYGSTEAEPIASIDADQVSVVDRAQTREGAGLLVGRPVSGCSVRVIDSVPGQPIAALTPKRFARLCVADGTAGEIVVSGDHVINGYADIARDAECKIHVNDTVWHRTGDAGYFDSYGRLWLVGRAGAALRDFRGTVYPFQVEYAVGAVRGVRRAALVEKDGERILALETSGREFRMHCAEAAKCVARFEIDRIVTLSRIPMDARHGAKVDYPALVRLLDGHWAGIRNRIAQSLGCLFAGCRDAMRRLSSRRQIASACKRRTGCSRGGSDSTVRL